MALSNFYSGTTKNFTLTLTFNDSTVDISSDSVIIRFKSNKDDSDADAVITSSADVTSQGSSGIALFALSKTVTAIDPGSYNYDIEWIRSSGDEYVVESGSVTILERVSDIPSS
uniref:Uncharacterized protein n=1 Tax=viral metagenome TaxID=1070528 RepID=A0A6M3IQD5_9ZZZZ